MSAITSQDVNSRERIFASIYFLKRSKLFEAEKPYAFRFPVQDIAQTNMNMERVDSISISNIRNEKKPLSFEDDGIAVLTLKDNGLESGSVDETSLQSYFRALEELLKNYLQASHVRVFRHGVSNYIPNNSLDSAPRTLAKADEKGEQDT
ncbi:MAG: hypothetical protein M1822_000810 [Bathelium mastoideum]|nr:MAG: hypothetical protein M1822_000810 [Bathelium mastoideum]